MSLIETASAWLGQDPDDETRAELERLITDAAAGSDAATAELHDRFDTRLEFGTAGLRGRIEAGSNRMNRVLVAQATGGLAAYLVAHEEAPSIVIGYDGRKNSRIFAYDTAELMAGAGVRAIILPRLMPTPVLAFAVRHLGVSAGVMVTASHNPPADNGYKVYLGGENNGSQIVTPADAEIAAQIERVAAEQSVLDLPRSNDYETAGEEVLDEYVRRTAAIVNRPERRVNAVYTPLHGVGWETAHRVFVKSGFGAPTPVLQQVEPDPNFPTVAFPNPEEPGAMDLAFALATRVGAELVLANDPDADRLAVGVPTADNGWERLSGNEVGALLGWHAAEKLRMAGSTGTFAASIVSSPALAAVAREYQLGYADTLTGFKWVSRVPGLSYGYEEALGYLVDPDKVRDKDGISAALVFLELFTEITASGSTFAEHRAAFADKFGAFASAQVSIRVTDLADIGRIMGEFRATPPQSLAGSKVDRIDDFAGGFGDFLPNDILRIWLDDGSRVIVRPSGTEPKVKVYIDASSTVGTALERQHAAQAAVDRLEASIRELLS